MKSISHILSLDNGTPVPFRKSPNTGGKLFHKFLVIHYDASSTAEGAISWMASEVSQVSAHLHISREGKVVQLVPFDTVAWHAGQSYWKGISGLNSHSIGIELQNNGSQPYTQIQLDVLTEVAKALVKEYKLTEILGHSDISPGRKIDPGKHFPMAELRQSVFGVEKLKVTADVLNVRSGAGVDFPVTGTLLKGSEVNVLTKKDNWSEVFICETGTKGWVSNKYLK